MNKIMELLKKADELVSKIVKAICVFCLGAVFFMFIANVFVRFVPIYNFKTTDQLITLGLVWIVFFGSQEMVREKGHFVVDVLTDRVKGKTAGYIMAVIADLLSIFLYFAILYFGIDLVKKSNSVIYSLPFLTQGFYYACIPVSAFFMTLYGLRDLIKDVGAFTGKKTDGESNSHIEGV